MNLRLLIPLVLGGAAVTGAAALAFGARGAPKPQGSEHAEPFLQTQNAGPGTGTVTPLSRSISTSGPHKLFDTEVRFFDVNGIASSDAILTTEACSAHGAASLLRSSAPVTKRRQKIPPRTREAWCFLCSRAADERMWRVHSDPVKLALSNQSPTPFALTAADIRKGREPGATLLVQCVVCSKRETVAEVNAPDALKSAIGASEVRTLILNTPIGATAALQSINGTAVDSTPFINSPRLANVVARVRNLPAGARPYIVAQSIDRSTRWVSLLEPQNGLSGDRFIGTAVLGPAGAKSADDFQKFWVTVVVSHGQFPSRNPNSQAVAISGDDWESHYAPMLQPLSEEPAVVRRLPTSDPAAITLNIEGAGVGQGALDSEPIPVGRYFDAFGEADTPRAETEPRDYTAWLLIYREADFGQAKASAVPVGQEKAKLEAASWTLPWACLPDPGRYVAIAALTARSDTPPRDVTDDRVLAFSQPKLIELKEKP